MSEVKTKHQHLEWAIRSRARNQECCLRLLRLFDEEPGFWKTKKASRATQELIAIAFSLWRAAFLAEKTGKRDQVFAHGRDFLARLIEDNAIAYPQDKTAREWTFNYYTRNARYSLEYLSRYWDQVAPSYSPATRTAVERWDYCQTLLDHTVENFEVLLQERKKIREEKAKVASVRRTAKQRRTTVRELTANDRKHRLGA